MEEKTMGVIEKQESAPHLGQVETQTENVQELGPAAEENMLGNDEHALRVLTVGTGGDDQSHVSLPQIKELVINSTGSRT